MRAPWYRRGAAFRDLGPPARAAETEGAVLDVQDAGGGRRANCVGAESDDASHNSRPIRSWFATHRRTGTTLGPATRDRTNSTSGR